MPVLPPNAIQGADADAAQVANVIDPQALGAEAALPPLPTAIPPLPVDALAAAASAPPPVAGDAVDAAVAPLLPPAGGPALSLVPPPPPEAPPGTPSEQAARNVTLADEIGAEGVANATEKAGLDQRKADEEAKVAAEREKRLGELVARQEVHRQAAEARTADARAKAEAEPFHTFWETRSIGQNIATGIGLILGGISWNANHVNRGVDLLERMMSQDLQLQKEKHADLWRAVESAEKGETTLDASQLRETARFNAVEAAKHDAVASRLNAAIAMNRGKGDITTAKKTALAESEKANQFWDLSAKADAAANHQKEIDAESARHHQEQEKTAALRAAKYKTKGGGTGGAGSGFETAIQAMQAKADAGGTLGEIIIAGKALGRKEAEKQGTAIFNAKAKGDHADLVLSEKDAARTVHWNGQDWLAPRANQVKDYAKDIANSEKYQDLIKEVADDIRKKGFIIDPGGEHNPITEAGKRRVGLVAELQALGRQISALQATDAGTKLEHQMIGAAGVGLKPGIASPDVLLELGARAKKLIDTKFRAGLTPVKKDGAGTGESKPTKIVRPTSGPYKGKEVRVDDEGNIFL
jgi:hypothetical protein